MLRKIAVAAAVAALGLTLVTTDAFARGPGGFRGGFTGARVGGPAFRSGFVNQGFRGPQVFNRGARFANPGFRRFGPGFRRYGYVGLPLVGLGAYGAYSYYNNQCVVPRNVLTPWGYRTQWINVCDDYLY
jgi:hypothetical protein